MIKKGFETNFGDEFIISLAADRFRENIKNADGYMGRFWTGTFRYISTCYKYDPVSVLHVPAEKNYGMIKMYNYIKKYNSLPKKQKVYKILHLRYPSICTFVKWIAKALLNFSLWILESNRAIKKLLEVRCRRN